MNGRLKAIATRQGGVVSRAQAMSAGYTREQIHRRLTDGRWERIRYGQYAERSDTRHLPSWERGLVAHRRLVHAAMNSMRPGTAVVSHHSALVLHGVPVWLADLSEVQLTRTAGARSGPRTGVRHHWSALSASDLTTVDGLAVTALARAVVEVASTSSFEAAVVSADAAFRRSDVNGDELRRLRELTDNWPGGPRIRAVLDFADPLSESVGETRLRILLHNEGFPAPTLQAEFVDADGFVGRVDFWFPEYNTVVEFDGLTKYGEGSREVLIREKMREDRLRALGLEVVRITWADLEHPARTAMRIRQAFDRARPRRWPADLSWVDVRDAGFAPRISGANPASGGWTHQRPAT
ncbi:type IV toxin-antitoxin system AbiEi family antitoxin domain-containing protein [Kribbella sp. NPDC059898]|uniref:type IV toxin-antitoxin system AbiEi family antitoxin domain-containing protein n=1 Tax=Kribbella sp. NPDC059898 TaxID=3346995 RepID=UPI003661A5EF